MENPIKMDDLGVPLFLETPMSCSCFFPIYRTVEGSEGTAAPHLGANFIDVLGCEINVDTQSNTSETEKILQKTAGTPLKINRFGSDHCLF